MAVPRLHVAEDLAAGGVVPAAPPQVHYLRHVLRLAEGAPVVLFNGRDGEWLARLRLGGKRDAALEPVRRLRPQPPPGSLWLCFAPLKKARIDLVAEKATELGCAVLQPVDTRRSEPARIGLDRLRAIAREAAEQCGRLDLPVLREPVELGALLGGWDTGRALLVCAETGAAEPPAAILPGLAGRPAALLVGPEGGFTDEELDGLRERPFVRMIGLGPRILRAETAAIAALSCWQCLAGDWRERPPTRSMIRPVSLPEP